MKKNLLIVMIGLIAISLVIVIWKGFHVGLEYGEHTTITIDLEKEFQVADIRKITNEVFSKQSVMIQPVEEYQNIVRITVKSVSSEQLENLLAKINEQYELERTVDDVSITDHANFRLRDFIKPYLIPTAIATLIIFAYELLRFRKLGIQKVLMISIAPMIGVQVLLACIYAICRIPVNSTAMLISMALYVASAYYGTIALRKQHD